MKIFTNETNYEKAGYDAIIEANGDIQKARDVMHRIVQALEIRLKPKIAKLGHMLNELDAKIDALHDWLYKRAVPADDATLIRERKRYNILLSLLVPGLLSATSNNAVTYLMRGWEMIWAVAAGMGMTFGVLLAGYFLFELVVSNRLIYYLVMGLTAFLIGWGIWDIIQSRGVMAGHNSSSKSDEVFVNQYQPDPSQLAATNQGEPGSSSAQPQESDEQKVDRLMGQAVVKFMVAIDIVVGILLGWIRRIQNIPDFIPWCELSSCTSLKRKVKERLDNCLARIKCVIPQFEAGIMRGLDALSNAKNKRPFFRVIAIISLWLFGLGSTMAQNNVNRLEAMLLDDSGSIAMKTKPGANELFRDYLFGAERLILTEPSDSRVWVFLIDVDSFGGRLTVLRGYTPSARGVFADKLNAARRQLVEAFKSSSAGLAPTAAGTDIIGSLFRAKTAFDSFSGNIVIREIHIFSDMINESQEFSMPILFSAGHEKMLEIVKAKGLIVSLEHYKIVVHGASTLGLTPQEWNTIHNFWVEYFKRAGAQLVNYSSEVIVQR